MGLIAVSDEDRSGCWHLPSNAPSSLIQKERAWDTLPLSFVMCASLWLDHFPFLSVHSFDYFFFPSLGCRSDLLPALGSATT